MITGFHKNIILHIMEIWGEGGENPEELLRSCNGLTEDDKTDVLRGLQERKVCSLAALLGKEEKLVC